MKLDKIILPATHPRVIGKRTHNLTEKRFGKLVVISIDHAIHYQSPKNPNLIARVWRCVCDCGNETLVTGSSLRHRGKTEKPKSCGCVAGRFVHGYTVSSHPKHRLWKAWRGMRDRCSSSSREFYFHKGIKVCERWNSFENFLSDMGPTWSPELSLDRIDNNGNYCPENCRWATSFVQCRNKSNNRFLTCRGETKTIAEWAQQTGLSRGKIYGRLENGWSEELTLMTPPKAKRMRLSKQKSVLEQLNRAA